jgi:hypothetical protein
VNPTSSGTPAVARRSGWAYHVASGRSSRRSINARPGARRRPGTPPTRLFSTRPADREAGQLLGPVWGRYATCWRFSSGGVPAHRAQPGGRRGAAGLYAGVTGERHPPRSRRTAHQPRPAHSAPPAQRGAGTPGRRSPRLPPENPLQAVTISDKRWQWHGDVCAAQCRELITNDRCQTVTVGKKRPSVRIRHPTQMRP